MILFQTENIESIKNEMDFLKKSGYKVFSSDSIIETDRLLERSKENIRIVIIGLVGDSADKAIRSAQEIASRNRIPIFFYSQNCTREVLNRLSCFTQGKIIPAPAGLDFLLHSIEIEIGGQSGDTFNRLVKLTEDSNNLENGNNYSFLISGLLEAIIIDDNKDKIIQVNNKACEILGISREQMIGGEIYNMGWQFIREDLTPFPIKEHPHLIVKETGKPVRNIVMGINKPDKETLWISSSAFPVFSDESNKLQGVITTFYDISDFISIKNNNLRLAAIFKNADWGIAIGSVTGPTIDQINPAYARMHGYEEEELVGKPISTVFPEDEWDTVKKNVQFAFRNGHHRFSANHLKKDGTPFPTVNDVTTIYDHEGNPLYRAVNVVDMTETQLKEEQLKKSLEQLREAKDYSDILFNNSPIAIYSVDKNGKVVNFNKKAEEITGFSREEVKNRSFPELLKEDPDHSDISNESAITAKDGHVKIIEKYSSDLFDFKGNEIGGIESFIDITEWKRLEEYKTDIERIIRHDLKTPLNSIIGFPKLMLTDEELSDEYREYLMIILLAGQNMLNMINSSLNLYKLEQGSYKIQHEKAEVITILKQVRRTLRDDCSRKKNAVLLRLAEGTLEKNYQIDLMTEKSFLFMILLNLIKNAVEASPKGEDVIVTISRDEKLEIRIHNKGAIPQSVRLHFFEKNITYGKKHGNGLGTYSAKLMADALGADLDFTTDEIDGTTLFLKL